MQRSLAIHSRRSSGTCGAGGRDRRRRPRRGLARHEGAAGPARPDARRRGGPLPRLPGRQRAVDQYCAQPIRQGLSQRSLTVTARPWTNESKASAATAVRRVLYADRLSIPGHPELVSELVSLEQRPLPSGRVRIAAPAGGHDDYATALLMLVDELERSGATVVSIPYRPSVEEPVVRRGGLLLRGKQTSDVPATSLGDLYMNARPGTHPPRGPREQRGRAPARPRGTRAGRRRPPVRRGWAREDRSVRGRGPGPARRHPPRHDARARLAGPRTDRPPRARRCMDPRHRPHHRGALARARRRRAAGPVHGVRRDVQGRVRHPARRAVGGHRRARPRAVHP